MAELSGTFTATGTSNEITVNNAPISITGTFVATIELQRKDGSNWVDVKEYTSESVENIEGRGSVYRFNCSAYTSGTVNYFIG
jgi:hypothetical protein